MIAKILKIRRRSDADYEVINLQQSHGPENCLRYARGKGTSIRPNAFTLANEEPSLPMWLAYIELRKDYNDNMRLARGLVQMYPSDITLDRIYWNCMNSNFRQMIGWYDC